MLAALASFANARDRAIQLTIFRVDLRIAILFPSGRRPSGVRHGRPVLSEGAVGGGRSGRKRGTRGIYARRSDVRIRVSWRTVRPTLRFGEPNSALVLRSARSVPCAAR